MEREVRLTNPQYLLCLLALLILPDISRADKVDDYIKAQMQKRQIPGLALAVMRNGKIIKEKGYGLAM